MKAAARARAFLGAALIGSCALALSLAAFTRAAFASTTTDAEIAALLDRLQASGCEFNRNGDWHPAAQARVHLERKLDYIRRNGELTSAEQFIRLAASSSSMSGTPYQVRCGKAQPMTSERWLSRELAAIRGRGAAPSSSPRAR